MVYLLPDEAAVTQVRQAFTERFRVSIEPLATTRLTYLDTFDGRVYGDGGVLVATPLENNWDIEWKTLQGKGRGRWQGRLPAFAEDLPAGPIRDALTPVLEMRRLLPMIEWLRQGERLSLLDDLDKTVVRVTLERATVRPATELLSPVSEEIQLPFRLAIQPVRGFDKALSEVVDFIADDLSLQAASDHLKEALATFGRRPGDYSSKVRLQLQPDMRADAATRLILRSLLSTMSINEPGLRQNLDSEFLHDFRVAVRRTRSALAQIKGVLPAAAVEHFRKEFSWLGSVTGPTRDLDVYLLKMDSYKENLPPAVGEALEPLEAFLQRRQKLEHGKLVEALDRQRYRQLLAAWNELLEQPAAAAASADAPVNAAHPIAELASERIWKVYRRVRKRGAAIHPETPAAALHDLRIECKKLRYLMEFFHSLYPADAHQRSIKTLKRLQDNLGDFNDYEVQQDAMRDMARQMLEEPSRTADLAATLLAMGRLVARLEEGQARERRRFHECFADFTEPSHHRGFKQLFGTPEEP